MIDERLSELGIELPTAAAPLASYVPVHVAGEMAYVAGQIPLENGSPTVTGIVGRAVSLADAQAAARRCALQALAALRSEFGSLDRVTGVVQVWAWIASDPSFTEQPKVANAASDLLVDVFGEAGRHARAAVGVPVLPLDASVEVAVVASV
jgi:enamine deaminase RidA (YjgF/YER057c/UK114 family)